MALGNGEAIAIIDDGRGNSAKGATAIQKLQALAKFLSIDLVIQK